MNAVVPYQDIERMAGAMVQSNLFGLKNTEQAIALMLVAQAEGLHPATVAVDYDFIQGKPTKKPVAMLRDFIKGGGKVEWHALDDTQADATFSHPAGGVVRVRWDMEKARQAQLAGKDNWKKYPAAMLRSRCVSEGLRAVFPAATGGLYTPEEVHDFDPPRSNGNGHQNGQVIDAEIVAPDGYEKWKADMAAVADEGTEKLQAAWQQSASALRRHVVDNDAQWWTATKDKAAKVAQ